MFIDIDNKKFFASNGGRKFDSNKKCIIFIHGAGMDHTVWFQQSRFFANKGFSVISIDLQGHGKSEGEASDDVKYIANSISKVIDHLKIKEVAIVGHSLGALISIELAKIDTKIISELVLLGVCLPMNVSDELLTNAQSNNQDALNFITMWGHSNFSHLGQNIVPGIWLTGSSKKLLETSSKGVLFSDLMAVKNYKEDEKTLNKILCPTLIICGSEDMMTPLKNVVILEKNINKLSKIVLPNCGHMMMLEEPDIVRSEIASFLSSPSK